MNAVRKLYEEEEEGSQLKKKSRNDERLCGSVCGVHTNTQELVCICALGQIFLLPLVSLFHPISLHS